MLFTNAAKTNGVLENR